MRNKLKLLFLFVVALTIMSCNEKNSYEVGQSYDGFKLQKKKFVKEVNANCLYFIHEKSGARLLKIDADDSNKLFNIAFKTRPEDDCGTPHIMEHSVLNGSTNFPVKSPFDVLTKGSLNTFLNAMTSSDMTSYPVASMNTKDYYNLMHVYLDAVFNPLLRSDKRILNQEGWHYELDNVKGDIIHKGVVLNEMKGAFSSASRELSYQIDKALFPDNCYGNSSGGYPSEITKLTQKKFVEYHKKYYHPTNSYILLYGNADLNRELKFINEEYLSKYEKSNEKIEFKIQKPFNQMKEIVKSYPVPKGSSLKDKSYLALEFVVGKSVDRDLCMAFNVIASALVNHESAPLKLALQKAGIGKDVSAYFSQAKQNSFRINVRNANPQDKDKLKQIVFDTFKEVAKSGFDKKMLQGIFNSMEFHMKEGNSSQKGMMYLYQTKQTWMFGEDPFAGLEYNKTLENLKKSLNTDIFQKLITENLIKNNHAVLAVLKPEAGLQKVIDTKLKAQLAKYKASLSKDELSKLVAETKSLKAYQKKKDSPEDLAVVPMLALSDIGKDVEWFGIEEKKMSDIKVLYHKDFTNNILYSKLYFDLRVLPQELIPYASLLSTVLGSLNTENYSYGELDNAFNIHTGGCYTYTSTFLENNSDDKMIPKFVVSGKSISEKGDKLFNLTMEMLKKSKFNDFDRLKTVLTRHQARVESGLKNNGVGSAMRRLSSYFSNEGMFNELTDGLEYYKFITDITNNFDSNKADVANRLKRTADLLFSKNNTTAAITCSDENLTSYAKALDIVATTLPNNSAKINNWKFDFSKKNEGLMSASKVQYVIKGYDFKKLGYKWNGKMRVLKQVLSREWLQTQIRVLGGAYGGFCGFSPSGSSYFASYRDPNLTETLKNFDNTPSYLDEFNVSDGEMTRFIIGTISKMDGPTTASQRGSIAVNRYFKKTTHQSLKDERNAVLTTKPADLKAMSKMVKDILSQDAICVFGNQEKIKTNKNVFRKIFNVTN